MVPGGREGTRSWRQQRSLFPFPQDAVRRNGLAKSGRKTEMLLVRPHVLRSRGSPLRLRCRVLCVPVPLFPRFLRRSQRGGS